MAEIPQTRETPDALLKASLFQKLWGEVLELFNGQTGLREATGAARAAQKTQQGNYYSFVLFRSERQSITPALHLSSCIFFIGDYLTDADDNLSRCLPRKLRERLSVRAQTR